MSFRGNHDAHHAILAAVRLHGHKRGWHLAAVALGISDRTARAILDGTTSGATIDPDIALQARMEFRRARAAQLRAELIELENECTHIGDGARGRSDGQGIAALMPATSAANGHGA